jgi:N-acetylmuramoyl-L-alanine amidase
MRVVLSSGHGALVPGASDIIDEVEEARRVVDRVADFLKALSVDVIVFHDDSSTSQDENLDTIVAFHNAQQRDLDCSIHFNAFQPTDGPRGTEVLYLTQDMLADDMASAIANAGGLLNRGGKYRDDLAFLNDTDEPAILVEVCFVDSEADVAAYQDRFDEICEAIARSIVTGLGSGMV